jgi:hypothetical protein
MYKWSAYFLLSVNFVLQNKGVQDQSWPKLDVDSVIVISWQSVLLEEETRVPGETH